MKLENELQYSIQQKYTKINKECPKLKLSVPGDIYIRLVLVL